MQEEEDFILSADTLLILKEFQQEEKELKEKFEKLASKAHSDMKGRRKGKKENN